MMVLLFCVGAAVATLGVRYLLDAVGMSQASETYKEKSISTEKSKKTRPTKP